jgi:hypothetical protein
MQKFLGQQLTILDQLKAEDEKDREAKKAPKPLEMSPHLDESGHVNEHIGPVQFNMGGIQVDADDMLRRLKVHINSSICTYMRIANLILRNEKPTVHPRKKSPHPQAQPTRKLKTKHSPASLRDSSKSLAAVRVAVLHPILINKYVLPVNTLKSTASGETYWCSFI